MNFLKNLTVTGFFETSRSYSVLKGLDPVERLRMNFVANARKQIEEAKGKAEFTVNSWISPKEYPDGKVRYSVSLRVGPKLLRSDEGTHFVVDSLEDAVTYLEAAISACELRELDELLKKTAAKKERPDSKQAAAQKVILEGGAA